MERKIIQLPVGGGGTPCVSLVQGWVKSGLDSRRLSYLSELVAEGLGFATVVHGTSISPCVSSVPLRVWTPSEALVCDVLCEPCAFEHLPRVLSLCVPRHFPVVGVGLI